MNKLFLRPMLLSSRAGTVASKRRRDASVLRVAIRMTMSLTAVTLVATLTYMILMIRNLEATSVLRQPNVVEDVEEAAMQQHQQLGGGAETTHRHGVHENVIKHMQTLLRHRLKEERRPPRPQRHVATITNAVNQMTEGVDPTNAKLMKDQPPPPQHQDPTNANKDKCLSPEKDIPWILDGTCLGSEIKSSSPRLSSQKRTCGLCGEGTAYFQTLRDELEAKYRGMCEELVVYGAAMGEKYAGWMRSPNFFHPNAMRSVMEYDTCMFTFVSWPGLDPHLTRYHPRRSADGSQIIIYIDLSKLPYESDRRNVKLLKLNPGLLFPWAKRIIWQDTKLLRGVGRRRGGNKLGNANDMPVDYLGHFRSTIERFGVCSSFVGLPLHPSSIKDSTTVNLMAHCDAIIDASRARPTVSDSVGILHAQCQAYYDRYSKDGDDPESQLFHQHPMIDSAFMLFDMQSERCRRYNGDLLCSWLDEIHCYTDRDQVSFSSAFASSGVQLVPQNGSEYYRPLDKVYVNRDDDVPMAHIANPNCHWYFHLFAHCIAQQLTPSTVEALPSSKKVVAPPRKVAVIVAGTMRRFLFRSTIDKVIGPMVEDGIDVDYYLSLITGPTKAYRSASGYMDHVISDLDLHGDDTKTSSISDYITELLTKSGANARVISIQEDIDIDEDALLAKRRESARAEHPDEDPDLRFPILDLRSEEIRQRTATANRNLLKKYYAIWSLWKEAVRWEERSGEKYDIVIFMSDDSYWISEFKLEKLLSFGSSENNVYVPSCDVRDPPMHPQEINDHILISKRSSADTFGGYYTKLFEVNTWECMNRLDRGITKNMRRGCNSEMLLKYVMDKEKIRTRKVPQSLVPFQRSVNVEMPDGSTQICFHKFCQSEWGPIFTNGPALCKDADWSRVFSEQYGSSE